MAMEYENIRWLKELGYTESKIIGRKAARLAQLANAGITVPRGFVITSTEFFSFLQKNNIKFKILEILRSIDYTKEEDIEQKSNEIKQLITKGKINQESEIEIYKYYGKLGEVGGGWLTSSADAFVAIRSSIVCEDGEVCDNKFIEQEGGFLNVKGRQDIIKTIKETWSTLYSKNVLKYANEKNINVEKLGMGVIIQNMISAKISGIMISSKSIMDPNTVIIEGVYGFGGSHVIKEITPDHYETQKKPYLTLEKIVSKQEWELKRIKGQTTKVSVIDTEKEKQKVNTHLLKDLTNTALKLEEFFGTPQLIEWAMDKADIYIISSEAVNPSVIEKTKKESQQKINVFKKQLLVKGVGVSNGIINGVVVNILNYNDLEKVNNESIIITSMTDQEMIGAIKLARGVVTNAGSSICHAAVVCKDLKKPCIVGTKFATEQLLDGEKIQINGVSGEVFSIASLDFVDLHPEEDNFVNDKEQRMKKHWEEQRELRSKGAVIINKKKEKPTVNVSEHIIYNKPETTNTESKTNFVDEKGNLNIKDLYKIDLSKTKQIVIPIEELFNSEEKAKLSNEFVGTVGMVTKEKIKRILKNIKEF